MSVLGDRYLTTDEVIALSDLRVVEKTFDVIGEACGDCDNVRDALYRLVDEMLERFVPELARADLERIFKDDPNRDVEIESALDGIRRREAARMLRDALEGDESDA